MGRDGLRTVAAALLALLLLELAAIAALVASAQPGDPPEPDPLPEVRDRTPHVVVRVDEECPVCWHPAIATTEETVCNNELCLEYGRVQKSGSEYPEVDEYLRGMGELVNTESPKNGWR